MASSPKHHQYLLHLLRQYHYFDSEIYQNEKGIFTLITGPTKPNWPGPLIIYCTSNVPADNIIDELFWEAAMVSDGKLIEPFGDFCDL